MSDLDLSLPAVVPGMEQYRDRPMTLDSFAVYNLVSPEDPQSDLVETCNSLCPRDDYVHFRKTSNVNSLESLINLHLETTAQEKFDPGLFLVAADQDWKGKGLYIVTLEDDEGKPDEFLVKAEDSGILLVNLQIGNTDWSEAKESYEVKDDDGTQKAQLEGTFSDGARKQKPATGFYIGFYAIPGVDPNELIEATEPCYKMKAPEDRVSRFEGFLDPDKDLVSQASYSWHPQACMANPYLCKMYFFIVDSKNYQKDGFLLCNVKEHKTKRVVCSQGITVPEFCNVAQGDRKWD